MKYFYVGATPDTIAETEREALAAVGDLLSRDFGVRLRYLELPAVDFTFNPARGQYASTAVLEMLVKVCPGDALKLLGVTARDLFIPVLTFVYGHAQLGGRVGVVSLARLRQEFYGLGPDREVFLQRAAKEALHEAGHMFGLVHCADRACAMSLSTNIRQIDAKRGSYCPACAALLSRKRKEA